MRNRTYRTKSYGSSSEAYQAAVTGMRLMNSICELIAELVEDGRHSGIVLGDDKFTNSPFEPVGVYKLPVYEEIHI